MLVSFFVRVCWFLEQSYFRWVRLFAEFHVFIISIAYLQQALRTGKHTFIGSSGNSIYKMYFLSNLKSQKEELFLKSRFNIVFYCQIWLWSIFVYFSHFNFCLRRWFYFAFVFLMNMMCLFLFAEFHVVTCLQFSFTASPVDGQARIQFSFYPSFWQVWIEAL